MKAKAITQGAMLCALAVLLALLCYYVPFLWLFYMLIPVPIVVLAERQGLKVSIIASIAATLILFMMMDVSSAALFGMYLLILGCGLGYVYHRGLGGFPKLLVGYVAAALVFVLGIVLFQLLMGQNYIAMLSTEIQTTGSEVLKLYQSVGLSGEQLAKLEDVMEQMVKTMQLVIPTSFLIAPFFISVINIVVSDKILKRLKLPVVPLKPISAWRAPISLRLFLGLTVIGTWILEMTGAFPEIYSFTLMSVVGVVFFTMGISFLFWSINRSQYRNKTVPKVLIVVACLIFSYGAIIVALAGMMDIFMNIRKFIEEKGDK